MPDVNLLNALSVLAATNAHSTSAFLHFAEDKLQIIALSFMVVVYIIKVGWILRFKAGHFESPAGRLVSEHGWGLPVCGNPSFFDAGSGRYPFIAGIYHGFQIRVGEDFRRRV